MLDDDPTADAPIDEPAAVQSTPEPDPAATPETEAAPAEDSTPPWGEDFDPERAWKTITHLRSREKELETAAKEYDRLKSDPEAQAAFLEQLGYELADEDDTDDDLEGYEEDDDEPLSPREQRERIARLEAWAQQEAAEKAQRAEDAALDRMTKGVQAQLAEISGLSEKPEIRERQEMRLINDARLLPFTPDGLPDIKAAHAAWLEELAEEKRAWADTKKAASVSPVGTTGTQVPDLNDPKQRHAYQKARLAALEKGD